MPKQYCIGIEEDKHLYDCSKSDKFHKNEQAIYQLSFGTILPTNH